MRINLIDEKGQSTEILEEGFIFEEGHKIFIPDHEQTYEVTEVIFYIVKAAENAKIGSMTQNVFIRKHGKNKTKQR